MVSRLDSFFLGERLFAILNLLVILRQMIRMGAIVQIGGFKIMMIPRNAGVYVIRKVAYDLYLKMNF